MNLINRELSWLAFNQRVLQESLDKRVPLIERVRFLGIYSNNMDEFFRVRVATIHRMIALKNRKVEGFEGSPSALLDEIQTTVKRQRRVFELSYARILKELGEQGFSQVNETTVSEKNKEFLNEYYRNELKRDIVPIIVGSKKKFPRLKDDGIYLAVKFSQLEKEKKHFALIQIPSSHPRFITLDAEEGNKNVILLDDVIRLHLSNIFSIFKFDTIEAYTFKFTRDAEITLDDDISISMMEKMEESIKQRKKGSPIRFVYDQNMPADLLKLLLNSLGIEKYDHQDSGGRYHNFKDFMKFPDFGIPEFTFDKKPALEHPLLKDSDSIIKSILKKDVLLHYPYQKFDYLVDLLRESAIDPKVLSIKINIYRVAPRSQVINALRVAIQNGKSITVVVELQARFDEENNMYWANKLREHGARIIYGVPGLKVHSKLIQITRKVGKKKQLVSHVGTGNFHGGTAKVYGDYGLLTADPRITGEVEKVFNLLENNIERGMYRNLFVSPFNTRRKFINLINREVKNAKRGLPAYINIKLNNLVDKKLINKLYDASKSGVKVRLIVRGICCLIPGKKGMSENIEAISIVDRYLEHVRYFSFCNNGDPEHFISSADWMVRNLDKRIEVTTPIFDKDIKQEMDDLFELQWKDNQKARILDAQQANKYREVGEKIHHSQEDIYAYYQHRLQN